MCLTARDRWLVGARSRGVGPRRAASGEVFVEAPGRGGGSAALTGDRVQGMGRWMDVETESTAMSWLVGRSGMVWWQKIKERRRPFSSSKSKHGQ